MKICAYQICENKTMWISENKRMWNVKIGECEYRKMWLKIVKLMNIWILAHMHI